MDENERRISITDSLWWWFPIRWEHDGVVYEVRSFELIGDISDGGVNVYITKDEGAEVVVLFTNEECIGDLKLQPDDARARVYSEVL